MLSERSRTFRKHSAERDKPVPTRGSAFSPSSSCPLHSLSMVCLLLSYPKFFRTRLVMEFSLAFLHSFDKRGRSLFPPNDLDDRSACFSFSRSRHVVLSLLLCDAAASWCTPHVSYMLSYFFSLFLSSVFVSYAHAIYVSSRPSIL